MTLAREAWARTRLLVWPERYRLVSLPPTLLHETCSLVAWRAAGTFMALVLERDEVSLTIEESIWAESSLRSRALHDQGPYRVITFDIDLDLALVGYLAPAAERLARAGVSIVPQCAFRKDHVLVAEQHLERAVAELQALIDEARR